MIFLFSFFSKGSLFIVFSFFALFLSFFPSFYDDFFSLFFSSIGNDGVTHEVGFFSVKIYKTSLAFVSENLVFMKDYGYDED